MAFHVVADEDIVGDIDTNSFGTPFDSRTIEEPDKRDKVNKILTVALCLIGILSVGYGMIGDSDGVFIFGILCVIGGYLLIRRKLKESIREKSDT